MGTLAKIVLVGWVVTLAAEAANVALTPAPAPAPAAEFLNVTDLLLLAGPFSDFLRLLQSGGLLKSIQAQANDSLHGVTLFAPSDSAFASLPPSLLGNLTAEQKKAVLLSHVISEFYTLQDFQNFSNPASTMASGMNGGTYALNITSKSGAVSVSTGYWTAPITSTVHVTHPVAVYMVPKVLLPQDIFGVAPPSPSPAPSPLPDATTPPGASASPPSKADPTAPAGSSASAPSIRGPFALLLLLAAAPMMLL